MTCWYPLAGWRARLPSEKGKYGIVFKVAKGDVDRPVSVPCGRCRGCRLDRSLEWAVRCTHESTLYEDNSFVTLTYRDECLPYGGSLSKRDLQLFLKRLRKAENRDKQNAIRFYACGEYGENLKRPHYHICLFNYRPKDLVAYSQNSNGDMLYSSITLDEIWGNGFTQTGDVTFQSAGYVARYIMKKINGALADQHYQNVCSSTGQKFALLPEFNTMSRASGIGKPWLKKYSQEIYDYEECIIHGKTKKIPTAYDREFESMDPDRFRIIKSRRKRGAIRNADNNTSSRLRVREHVQEAKIKQLKRGLDK